ncbi:MULTISPECIES: tRNA (adenosine(37)-N6)-threonylcarbamoyltransferase complex ATPase subunit type 1 TsaE [unclassified Polaribacter]|uniref:tRNA (adenosine(37)-N6)-threonylcarbamoyltransferase complex ATPase subunit type 1 TsaE n=1 Tax=unclassified Polaribacter TaxID=196858 RepID=UPI0011BE8F88|nr:MULTISPECIES: tRNA (adenosine(37)-N6)-threonylcarbamoyltransferase complex ATPase subunit type 1 TsaE [unclassified Polaribacter]TXD48502.1 tRNA (adenosine(37)-N6)-threonylcarbamoyltransferase complex ATPase subunit type 1 TsaE [Polaribacter sp. IC063]TXD55835.1 tRNA (adenosine(37)-N6)-threonylcarbamoyltransferase complex ATPase subunit type 1 TsaE [Polaribacter sp. IC066]
MHKNYSLENLSEIAVEIISSAKNKTILFYGEMGVGKTTLIKEICKKLGVLDTISSPTFSLVNEYQTSKNETVFHFDFYRITNEEEALDMGIEEYFDNNDWCLIEWPENIENLLPLNAVAIHLTIIGDDQRNIQIK